MDASVRRARHVALLLLLATLACVAVTVALFDRAYPLLDAGGRLDRAEALARAQALVARERLAPADARTAVRFETDDDLTTYVDLAAGGTDSLRALARRGDVPVAWWEVRFFRPGDPREVRVRLDARDGRVVSVARTLAESDRRPALGVAAARATSDAALARWGGRDAAQWRVVSGPTAKTQPGSGRLDFTTTYEHRTRRVGAAPLRAAVVVTGADSAAAAPAAAPAAAAGAAAAVGAALGVQPYVQIPEAFQRRRQEMGAANDLFAFVTTPLAILYIIVGVVAVVQLQRRGLLRTRPAAIVGGAVAVLLALAVVNAFPTSWFGYDTRRPTWVFVAGQLFGAVLGGLGGGLLVGTMLAAAEGLTRLAFPGHWDWYAFWRHRGARPIAARVLGGYALAAAGFAYVTLFYLAMRRGFGWWVPTAALDDPNQIATALPWVAAFGMSLFAGIWEEAAFRAIPLAALALFVRDRPGRRWWMAAGVVVTALVFGFGHANYPSWPPYSRGVELFVEAAAWAVLYLVVGLPTTIVAHVAYDLVWFGLFAAQGDSAAYRVTLAIVVAALFLPALAVLQRLAAQGWRWTEAPETARLAAWRRVERAAAVDHAPPPRTIAALGARRRQAAVALAAAGLLLAALWRPQAAHGPAFTASRARAAQVGDSVLRARGEDPARWHRLAAAETDEVPATTRRFFDRAGARARAVGLAESYLPVAWWRVRYVRTRGALAERAEEWSVRLLPDGRVLDVSRRVPESRPGAAPDTTAARALARAALPAFVPGAERARLREVELTQAQNPDTTRLDTSIRYEDEGARLPGGAQARVRVSLAGDTAREGERDVHLPEAFTRADEAETSARGVTAAVGGMLAFSLLLWLLTGALRRPPAPGPAGEPWLDRPRALAVAGFAAAAMAASSALALPATLSAWRTATSWSNFLALQAVQLLILALVYGAVVLGLWFVADGLRRRAGVPVWSAAPGGARDALLAGAALGLGGTVARHAAQALVAVRWPSVPATEQDALAPLLAGVSAVTLAAAMSAAVTIPVGAVALGARTWGARILVLLLAAASLAPVAQLAGGTTSAGTAAMVSGVAAAVVVGVALVLVVRFFGAHSGAAWVHAGLFGALAAQLAAARAAASATDRGSALVGAAAAALAVAWLHRAARRRERAADAAAAAGGVPHAPAVEPAAVA